MYGITPRNRLCEEVLGRRLTEGLASSAVTITIPILYNDIDSDVLGAAEEAIFDASPEHIRQILPFVLHVIEANRTKLFEGNYFHSFFTHANYDFHLDKPLDGSEQEHAVVPRYSADYRQNWIAPTVSAMNRFELGWAYEWTFDILRKGEPSVLLLFERDLTMLCRILAMALGKPESEAPSFADMNP